MADRSPATLMIEPGPPPDYCSVKTVARRLDCSESWVSDNASRGDFPAPKRVRGLVRWKWSEVEVFMDGAKKGGEDADSILAAARG